jgi:dihydrofolate synthase / folylpolyglutamate synthase
LGTVRARPLLATIAQHASAIHLVVPHQPRATSQSDLAALIPAEYKGTVTHTDLPSLFPSADQCTAGEADDVIVVTGSIYLIGEVMTLLGPQVGEGHLQDF